MKILTCQKCGGNEFIEQAGYKICQYCRSKYVIQAADMMPPSSNISLNGDVQMLLLKCRNDPANARRYAGLILDIDPGNIDAKRYL